MAEERIQKIMSEQGLCSRRAAEQIIAEGRVKVNGHPVKVGDKMDPNRDVLHVDDERIYIQKNQQMYYLALYKPRGYVTTASDELGRKTVMELVADIPARLYPVGRLDKDSEGLLLMTNDGAFAQAVTHPSGGISKLYRVTVQPRADEAQILKLSSGVVLDDGTKTMPGFTRSPAFTSNDFNTPASGEATGIFIFMASRITIGWPFSILSPTAALTSSTTPGTFVLTSDILISFNIYH